MRNWMVILCMAGVSYLLRVLPMTLLKKPITSTFWKSFLYYVPYVTLSVMTFPAMVEATGSLISGWLAFGAGIVLAYKGAGLMKTCVACCVLVFIAEVLIGG